VLVVNEPELAEAINRLRGEWAERGIGELNATAATWAEAAAEFLEADVLVFPSRYLGEMCGEGLLRPVRSNILESNALAADDFFPLVRQEIIQWGGQVMALPLGVQLVTSADGVESHPAMSLLARAAPQAVSNDRLGVLFDSQTMKPRIMEKAFVEALEELAALANEASKDNVAGEPSPGFSLQGSGGPKHDAASVPVIGYGDRLAGVTTSSRNAASAFKLLEWLAGADASSQFARAGDGTMPARRSLASSGKWYDESFTASERSETAKLLDAALSGEQFLMIPRLPGVDDYMAALDEAVTSAVQDNVAAQAALEKAAQRWEEITEAQGRAEQRTAYLNHLGIEP
jgi:ABC-type glycerol-3-phosphate transport system substrate-binding protein